MKKRLGCLLLAFVTALLSACGGRELENTVLIRVLGVDGGEDVVLTAAGDEEELWTAAGENFEEARQALPDAGTEYLSLTNVEQIIVGDRADLGEVLEDVMDDGELSPSATVWCASAPASALMEDGGELAARLDILERSAGGVTAVEALAALETDGEVWLPALTVSGGTLERAGRSLFREGAG